MGKATDGGDSKRAFDPTANLSDDNILILLSKNSAMVVLLISMLIAATGTYSLFTERVDQLLSEANREVAEGTIAAMTQRESGVQLEYVFEAAQKTYHGRCVLPKERVPDLEQGAPVEVYYSRAIPTIHRLSLAFPDPGQPEPRATQTLSSILGITALLGACWFVILFLSSWEHVYLFMQCFVRTGTPAWVQIRRILHNAAFVALLYPPIICGVAMYGSFSLGLYPHLWPLYAGGLAGDLVLMVLLMRRSPF